MTGSSPDFFNVEEHSVQVDPEVTMRIAVAVTNRQLQMWRSCFTAGQAGEAVQKVYDLPDGRRLGVDSPDVTRVELMHQLDESRSYGFTFTSDGSEIASWIQQSEATPLDGDPAILCDQIGRLLYDASNAEMNG